MKFKTRVCVTGSPGIPSGDTAMRRNAAPIPLFQLIRGRCSNHLQDVLVRPHKVGQKRARVGTYPELVRARGHLLMPLTNWSTIPPMAGRAVMLSAFALSCSSSSGWPGRRPVAGDQSNCLANSSMLLTITSGPMPQGSGIAFGSRRNQAARKPAWRAPITSQ